MKLDLIVSKKMSKDEITSLKEEFLKEIRDLEKRLNVQMTIKLKEITEKNEKFIQEFAQISKNNKSLTDLISSKNLETHKINELEIFKKKAEPMMLSHDIRINTAIKDLNDIKYAHAKEVSENLTVPGFVGPSCKYKSIANYIAVNIGEMEKLKNDVDNNKKENKELKRKLEDMIKTLLNLVDKSNEKSIEYVNNKMKHSEEIINKQFVEINDKIFNFRTLILTQDKTADFKQKILDEINEINYNKNEIDKIMNNSLKNIETNLENLKTEFKHEINMNSKSKIEKYENEIKELNKSIRETNMKIIKSNQIQSKLFKDYIDLKKEVNAISNNNNRNQEDNPSDFHFGINKNIFGTMRNINRFKTNLTKTIKIGEEKAGKNKVMQSFENNKTIESFGEIKYKSSKKIKIQDLKSFIKEKDKENILYQDRNEINEEIKNEQLNNNSSTIIEKEKNNYIKDNEYKLNNSIDNKNNNSYDTINEKYEEMTGTKEINKEKENNSLANEKKVIFKNNHNANSNEIEFNSITVTAQKEKKVEKHKYKEEKFNNKNNKLPISLSNSNMNKENLKLSKKNQKIDISNLISYGMNKQNKVEITPIEKNVKKETNSILQIFQETNSSIKTIDNNINTFNKTNKKTEGGYSLFRLAEIGVEEKVIETFHSLHNSGKIGKSSNLVKPFRNRDSRLYSSFDAKLENKINRTNNNYNNKKISSAFGRTSYSVYNKKDEGIQNLVNKRINSNYNKRYKHKQGDFNFELSPVAKIKIYDK